MSVGHDLDKQMDAIREHVRSQSVRIGNLIGAIDSAISRLDTLEGNLKGFQDGATIRLDGHDKAIQAILARLEALEGGDVEHFEEFEELATEAMFDGKLSCHVDIWLDVANKPEDSKR